jgi:two-component system sensor histidine kinase DegS
MDVVCKVEGKESGLSSFVSVTLYRIIQEACNNAVRHSKAKRILVRITFSEHNIELYIEDNGVGFDVNIVDDRAKEDFLYGFGLSTMRERARLLSGTFSIDTRPGAGTKVHVFVPVSYTSRKEVSYE